MKKMSLFLILLNFICLTNLNASESATEESQSSVITSDNSNTKPKIDIKKLISQVNNKLNGKKINILLTIGLLYKLYNFPIQNLFDIEKLLSLGYGQFNLTKNIIILLYLFAKLTRKPDSTVGQVVRAIILLYGMRDINLVQYRQPKYDEVTDLLFI